MILIKCLVLVLMKQEGVLLLRVVEALILVLMLKDVLLTFEISHICSFAYHLQMLLVAFQGDLLQFLFAMTAGHRDAKQRGTSIEAYHL